MRPPVLCAVIALAVSTAIYIDSSIPHPVWQFWWLPLMAGFWKFLVVIMTNSNATQLTRTGMAVVSGAVALAIVMLFNDTASAYLLGAWMLIGLLCWNYFYPAKATIQNLKVTALLTALALVFLPTGVNRITLKLPSISGQTHFSLHQEIGDFPTSGAHYYQRIVEYEELEIHIASEYYPQKPGNAPWLQIRDDQEGVIFVLQDVIYEHVLGLFSLSLHKIGESNMNSLELDPASDPVTFYYPENGGTRIENLKIGDRVWIRLPEIPADAIGIREIAIILIVRLLLWALIGLAIVGWRPVRTREDSLT